MERIIRLLLQLFMVGGDTIGNRGERRKRNADSGQGCVTAIPRCIIQECITCAI
jgi:hypothetical protein